MNLVVHGLSYKRSEKLLFRHLSFQVSSGQALHIRGPNGVGKTSLLQILTGLIPPLQGRVLWNSLSISNLPDFKKKLVYISHRLGMQGVLTPFENLYLFLLRRGLGLKQEPVKKIKQDVERRIHRVLQTLELGSHWKTLTSSLSTGQQQRLVLAKLLLVHADCWILDEPLTALDSAGIQFVCLLIAEQLYRGGMVIFTSHQPLLLPQEKVQQLFLSS